MPAKRKKGPDGGGKKEKRVPKRGRAAEEAAPPRRSRDEELASDSDEDNDRLEDEMLEEEEDKETADEKRLRLAREYLARLHQDEADRDDEGGEDDSSDDEGGVEGRLNKDVLKMQGKTYKKIADHVGGVGEDMVGATIRGHRLPVTCVSITGDETTAYSGGKDSVICRYDVATEKLVHKWLGDKSGKTGHKGHILALSVSEDGRYLASGGVDRLVHIYDTRTNEEVDSLSGHRDAVGGLAFQMPDDVCTVWHVLQPTNAAIRSPSSQAPDYSERPLQLFNSRSRIVHLSLHPNADPNAISTVAGPAFQMGSHQLYSVSDDRTVKVWNVDDMGYMETLYGHSTPIRGIDCLRRERCVSVGGDRTLRVWKIAEESQLILRGHGASIDCVCMLDDQNFVSGSQDGSVALWSIMKKKPAHTVAAAHRTKSSLSWWAANGHENPSDASVNSWVTSVAACRFTDLVASGSSDGVVNLWKVDNNKMQKAGSVPVPGVVNAMAFGTSGRVLVAGIGQEHRLGRWERHAEGKNGVRIIRLDVPL